MLCHGHARDPRVCSPPHRAPDRSDTGCDRGPSARRASRGGIAESSSRAGVGRSTVGAGWQEHRRARVDTSPVPRPAHIIEAGPVIGEPREGDHTGHPRASGHDVHAQGQVVSHGERAMTVPASASGPVDDGAPGSVEPTHALIWDGLEDLCGGPESLPWCSECFTDRRRTQACPWGALSRVVVEAAGDGPDLWDDRPTHDGTARG